jgi:hypothetical protein
MKSCKVVKSTKIDNDMKLSQGKITELEKALALQKESSTRITRKLKDKTIKLTDENNKLKSELKQSEQSKEQLLKELEEKRIKIREQKSIITTLQNDNEKSKGILIGMNSAKPHTVNNKITNNNIVNQKLSLIPIDNIEPFTIDLVNRNLNKYDYNTFLKGALGIVNYIKELTILELDDGTVEKNYACTNRSRNTFHRLVEDKEWKQDGGARFIQEILTALSGQASEHMERLTKELNDEPIRSNKKQVLLEYQMKLADLEYGLRNKNSKERNEIFNQVKTEVRDTNGC